MLKNYSLLFLFPLFLAIFVLIPQSVLAIDYTGCTYPLEYCWINVGENLVIDRNIPGFLCTEERWIFNKGTIDIFVPTKDCIEYANWLIHVGGLKERGFYVRDLVCRGIANGQQDEGCNTACKWCWDEECVNTTEGSDPGNLCGDESWTCGGGPTGTGVCWRYGRTGYCGPAGACKTFTKDAPQFASENGQVCLDGKWQNTPSANASCDKGIDCTTGNCSAALYYRGCVAGITSCTSTNWQKYSTWNTQDYNTISETGFKSGGTICSTTHTPCNGTCTKCLNGSCVTQSSFEDEYKECGTSIPCSLTIVLNSASGQSCNDKCKVGTKKGKCDGNGACAGIVPCGCASIGTDAGGTNGLFQYAHCAKSCVCAEAGTDCTGVMANDGYGTRYCSVSTYWTYCNCQ